MLWDIIRDFFVKYIFGGFDSLGEFYDDCFFSYIFSLMPDSADYYQITTGDIFFELPNTFIGPNAEASRNYICIADYLSTTATIIVLILLAIVVALGIRWLFRFLISRFTKWGL